MLVLEASSFQGMISRMREPLETVESTGVVVILHVLGARALSVVGVVVRGRSPIRVRRLGVACLTHIIGGRPHILLIESSVG